MIKQKTFYDALNIHDLLLICFAKILVFLNRKFIFFIVVRIYCWIFLFYLSFTCSINILNKEPYGSSQTWSHFKTVMINHTIFKCICFELFRPPIKWMFEFEKYLLLAVACFIVYMFNMLINYRSSFERTNWNTAHMPLTNSPAGYQTHLIIMESPPSRHYNNW